RHVRVPGRRGFYGPFPKNETSLTRTGEAFGGTPERIRTAVTALRERRPGPLDDGGPGGRRPPFPRGPSPLCTPERLRTAVTALSAPRPGPRDDGGLIFEPAGPTTPGWRPVVAPRAIAGLPRL